MATLKYRKSRKNKKQLRKKKRTYKKRKTTRRKKGGADNTNREDGRYKTHDLPNGEVKYSFEDKEGRIVYVNTLQEYYEYNEPNKYDPEFDKVQIQEKELDSKNLDHLTTKFMLSSDKDEQLELLKQIVADNKQSCGYMSAFFNGPQFDTCQKKKVHDYCTILKKVDEILQKDDRTEFKKYRVDIVEKLVNHLKKQSNELPYIIVNLIEEMGTSFNCNMLKIKQEP